MPDAQPYILATKTKKFIKINSNKGENLNIIKEMVFSENKVIAKKTFI